ncbi:MAG: hypothetical protein HY401_10545 [Elusimicrobia bacterium]|nr:hypothetical protein [Elusimicrobiota bacterium]
MAIKASLCGAFLFIGHRFAKGEEITEKNYWSGDIWKTARDIPWHKMDVEQKTKTLEFRKNELEYAQNNKKKKFENLKILKLGSTHGYQWRIKIVTPGLIGFKCLEYGDLECAVKYFYEDWLWLKQAEEDRIQKGIPNRWPGGPGDYDPLGQLIGELWEAGRYKETLRYYEEYFEDYFKRLHPNKSSDERMAILNNLKVSDPDSPIAGMIVGWEEAKNKAADKQQIMAKIEPSINIHHWFYSEDKSKNLEALKYYKQHNIKFIIENAAKEHKNPKVKKEAQKYLKELEKEEKKGSK